MFNIPMNTKPPMSLEQMAQGGLNTAGVNSGGSPMSAQQNTFNGTNQTPQYDYQQPVQQPSYQQTNYQQPVQQPGYQQTNYQQPVQQPSYQQANYQQPAQPVQRPTGNGVILKKGQKTSLSKMNPNLSEVDVCLGWDILNQACDLDASAFMLGANNRVVGDDWFVFYGQPASPDGSIVHYGDSRDGAGAGDDEVISIKLNQVNPQVQKIVFVVTINEALTNGLNFSMVANAYVRVVDKSTQKELVKFNLTEYYSNVTSMVVGEIYKHNGEWRLNPVGDGVARDLAGLCEMYGVNVAG